MLISEGAYMKSAFNNEFLLKWFLICISAILYALPFLFTKYLYGLILIALIPLFITLKNNKISFKEGFLWGYIYFILMFSGFIESNFLRPDQSLLVRVLPSVIICIYCSLFPAIIFYLFSLTCKKMQVKDYLTKLIIFAVYFWIYIYIIDNYLLLPLSFVPEGFFIFHPTLPLAYNNFFLYLIGLFGKIQITLLIIAIQLLITYFISINKYNLILVFMLLSSLLIDKKIEKIHFPIISKIAYSPISYFENFTCIDFKKNLNSTLYNNSFNMKCLLEEDYEKNLKKIFEFIKDKIINILKINPNIEIILIPEMAFVCNFCKQEHLLYLLNESNIGKAINIFCGSLKIDNEFYNTIYWIYNGKIIDSFDKTHLLFPGESTKMGLPWSNLIRSLYAQNWPRLFRSKNKRPLWGPIENFSFSPYICSEIFFNERPQDEYNSPIVAFCKDTWLKTPYIELLLFLNIKLKSVLWHREIIYINFKNGFVFNNQGNYCKLKNYNN